MAKLKKLTSRRPLSSTALFLRSTASHLAWKREGKLLVRKRRKNLPRRKKNQVMPKRNQMSNLKNPNLRRQLPKKLHKKPKSSPNQKKSLSKKKRPLRKRRLLKKKSRGNQYMTNTRLRSKVSMRAFRKSTPASPRALTTSRTFGRRLSPTLRRRSRREGTSGGRWPKSRESMRRRCLP